MEQTVGFIRTRVVLAWTIYQRAVVRFTADVFCIFAASAINRSYFWGFLPCVTSTKYFLLA